MLSKNLTVNRVGFSYNLAIKYRALSPDQAAQIANAIADSYIAEQLEGKYQSTKRATGWLQGRIEELNQKRALAERAVVDFKQEKNMIAADGKLLNEQQIAELNSQLSSALQKASEEKARLDRIDVVIRDDGADTKTSGTVADTLNNPIVTQLRTRYLELVNREANWSRKYGANHLAVVNLRNQIRDARGSILDELKRLRESYLSNYEIAKQQVARLGEKTRPGPFHNPKLLIRRKSRCVNSKAPRKATVQCMTISFSDIRNRFNSSHFQFQTRGSLQRPLLR